MYVCMYVCVCVCVGVNFQLVIDYKRHVFFSENFFNFNNQNNKSDQNKFILHTLYHIITNDIHTISSEQKK